MVKTLKRAVASLLAIAMLGSFTACSADKSWAMKTESLTAPIGTYIYYLYVAYQSGSASVKDTSKPVLDQEIDGQKAEAWIKDKALTYTKELFVLDDRMKELKLSLTADETKTISQSTDAQWDQASATLEKYGVSKNSFNLAFSEFQTKYQKIFFATYGKGGPKAVSDADLKSYFEKNYADFNMMFAPLYATDTSGKSNALTADETAALKKKFDGYAADVTSGKTTLRKAADEYKTSAKLDTDPYQSATEPINGSSGLSAEMVTLIKNLKNGEAKSVEMDGAYYILQKNDITQKTATQIGTEEGRNSIIAQMKATEFSEYMEKTAKEYTKATINQPALDSYKPSLFVTPAVSSAAPVPQVSETPETSSAASAASTASK